MSGSDLAIAVRTRVEGLSVDVDIRIPLTGVSAIFGPSGSGKTTLLDLIAGSRRPNRGRIQYADEVWVDTAARRWCPPHQRGVGRVFQDGQLFPHLSVLGNLHYAVHRAPEGAPGPSLDAIVEAMELTALVDRNPGTLSGGEIQRAAIARSLLTRPKLLLLDEPLSALDSARKSDLLPFLERLKSEFTIPSLYVSHDVDEVSRIADRVYVMEMGRVVASGRTDDVLSRFGLEAGRNPYDPASRLTGIVAPPDPDEDLLAVNVGEGQIWLASDVQLAPGTKIELKVSARDVSIATERPTQISIQNMMPATILAILGTKRPAFQTVQMDVFGQRLDAVITRKAVAELELRVGREVYALIKSATFHP